MSVAHDQVLGPEYQTIFDPDTCTRRGLCPVTQIRSQEGPLESHSLYYEQHGTGPEKIVFIMGVNSTSFGWLYQVEHFSKLPQYSVLVFDNRGVGMSGTPRGPYTTSGMAEDVIVLLDYLRWTEERSIHVVGLSMGGMIAQELADRIPDRITSLSLIVTTAGGQFWLNVPPLKGSTAMTRLLMTGDPDVKVPIVMDMLYPQPWLEKKAEGDPEGRTNLEVQSAFYHRRLKITRPQTPLGALSQMYAGLTHHVSPARLRKISSSIPKVLILTGDQDHVIRSSNSRHLHRHMPEAEFHWWEETGHGISAQWTTRLNELLEKTFEEGRLSIAVAAVDMN
ncbi:Alpha/Beta hydrolase protein [Suillus fuscotomentosus]|uniref:Alpha/Beta hydrolase protein n=1 Tax=Suillus fuscotomentosus TaxID=1912939 RepID=A0AAD4EDG1_9AGAM|nr:Alpha/Beta hydrolase protein [Suillus fuscotomentosus]KAG1904116.1 Alpha/Beta hydrolase protein [Suillus fuscotomentosus]